MADYAARKQSEGVKLHSITRHMLGLYNGFAGARLWRRTLGEDMRLSDDASQMVAIAEQIEEHNERKAAS